MLAEMFNLAVSPTEDGYIAIKQERQVSDGELVSSGRSDEILVHPSQIDALMVWMKAAAKQLGGK